MLQQLAQRFGAKTAAVTVPKPTGEAAKGGYPKLGQWLECAAATVGLEAEPVATQYSEVESLLQGGAPAVLASDSQGRHDFFALLGYQRGKVLLLGVDLETHRVPRQQLRDHLCAPAETQIAADVEKLLDEAGVAAARRRNTKAALMRQRLAGKIIGSGWLLRQGLDGSFWRLAQGAHLPRQALILLAAHIAEYLLLLASWWVIGRGALAGRYETQSLVLWLLLLLSMAPFHLLAIWTQGRLAISAGGLLRQRLLYGTLKLEPDETRQHGAGQLLGKVIETEAVEALALSSGVQAALASVELLIAVPVLALGAGGWPHAALLIVWCAIGVVIAWRYYVRRQRWSVARIELTHALVERMVGHRTRLAQEEPSNWHQGEDEALEHYLKTSQIMDEGEARFSALLPRGWIMLGVAGLLPGFVAGVDSTPEVAVGLGGILLGFGALRRLTYSLAQASGALIAWGQVGAMFRAASKPEVVGDPALAITSTAAAEDPSPAAEMPVLEANRVLFRYPGHAEPVLRGCDLRMGPRDRVLVEGPSGGGKSTLAAVLSGLRQPEAGLVLLGGLDRQTLGAAGWRRRIVVAPQFHENHVLTGTFAFNLLMGRQWPPAQGDMEAAAGLCRKLGLGELLDRMPAGMLQMVGQGGWQLSHGEKSRLYVARALLQEADIMVLDESFAALDPHNLSQALGCVLEEARAVMVIAHP